MIMSSTYRKGEPNHDQKNISIRGRRDLCPKKVLKRAKIRHNKLLPKMCLHKGNILKVVTIHDHVINILTYNEARQLGLLVLPQIEALLAIR